MRQLSFDTPELKIIYFFAYYRSHITNCRVVVVATLTKLCCNDCSTCGDDHDDGDDDRRVAHYSHDRVMSIVPAEIIGQLAIPVNKRNSVTVCTVHC